MKLTSENVYAVFTYCLFKDGEPTENHIPAQGIMTNVGFHPGRLESHYADIASMLSELPDSFMVEGGGGMTFLNACVTKDGVQWGEHQNMEQLFQLGLASHFVTELMPREMWSVLPGGMPYYSVKIPQQATTGA
jgi:hypothetical protein